MRDLKEGGREWIQALSRGGGFLGHGHVTDGATAKGSKDKDPDIGEKRKRTNFTATQTVFLTQTLEKGDLDTPEKRQKVAELFSRERKVIDT